MAAPERFQDVTVVWQRVFGWIPVPVFFIGAGRLDPFAGRACGVLVAIDERYRADVGLLRHELVHVRQFYRTAGLHAVLYLLSKKYRYRAEIEAYREQLRVSGQHHALTFASFLASRYGLNISIDQALADLRAA